MSRKWQRRPVTAEEQEQIDQWLSLGLLNKCPPALAAPTDVQLPSDDVAAIEAHDAERLTARKRRRHF